MQSRLILITGPKHSGKSLCAQSLEKIIDGEAEDLDGLIKKETGRTPRELFREGPGILMKAEAHALASVQNDDCRPSPKFRILAAGGGLIDNNEALDLLSKHKETIIIYLDVSPETAWRRILNTAAAEGELPPFLNTENPGVKPGEIQHALHKRRSEAYKALAAFTVSAENKNPEETAAEIAAWLDKQEDPETR